MGPYVHNIDPVIVEVGGVCLWWYGLSYTLGFLGVLLWLRRNRGPLAVSMDQVLQLSLWIAAGVLLGGRLVEVFFYEWAYYRQHPAQIPAVWLGGMSTHGILLGAILAILAWCRVAGRRFLELTDVLSIAAAYIMGVGRLGNFIDGQIAGSVTDVMWAVKFPDLDGYRHPVVLYDGLKNLLLIPLLLLIRRTRPPRGALTAHFLLWYGLLRVFVDLFREYRVHLMGFPPGQEFNLLMAAAGLFLLVWCHWRGKHGSQTEKPLPRADPPIRAKRRALGMTALVVAFTLPLVIPSDWTQDVPARYGRRHEGLVHSWWYPPVPPPEEVFQQLE